MVISKGYVSDLKTYLDGILTDY